MTNYGVVQHPTQFLHSDGPSPEKVLLVPIHSKTFPNGFSVKVRLDEMVDRNLIEWGTILIKGIADDKSMP